MRFIVSCLLWTFLLAPFITNAQSSSVDLSAFPQSFDLGGETCVDSNDGTITLYNAELVGIIGSGPYVFSWGIAGTPADCHQNFLTGLAPGSYSVGVQVDANNDCVGDGNTAFLSFVVAEAFPLTLTLDAVNSNPRACPDGSGTKGNLRVDVAPFSPSLVYQWYKLIPNSPDQPVADADGGKTNWISNQNAGVYRLVVSPTGNVNCQYTKTFEIQLPTAQLAVNTPDVKVDCGNIDGRITVSPTGGFPYDAPAQPYNYTWFKFNNLSNIYEDLGAANSRILNNAGVGAYKVVVTDANNCTAELGNINVVAAPVPGITLNTVSVVNPACNGGKDGKITVSVSGGKAPYEIRWYNLTSVPTDKSSTAYVQAFRVANLAAADNFTLQGTDVGAGDYSFVVIDANGCENGVNGYVLSEPAALTLDMSGYTFSQANCANSTDGSIMGIAVNGGTSPYTYTWYRQNDANSPWVEYAAGTGATPTLNPASVGIYKLVVKDANNCSVEFSTNDLVLPLNQDFPFSLAVTKAPSCSNLNGNMGNSSDAELTVTVQNLVLADGAQLQLFDNANNFLASIIVSSGFSQYSFTGLWPGSFTVKAVKGICDLSSQSISVVAPDPIAITNLVRSNETCFGFKDGSISVSVEGGTGNQLYQWFKDANSNNMADGGEEIFGNSSAQSNNLINVGVGVYILRVVDGKGCEFYSNAYALQGPTSSINLDYAQVSIQNVTCNGAFDGQIIVPASAISGGQAPYSYFWYETATPNVVVANTRNLIGKGPGDYILIVQDNFNCAAIFSANLTITQPAQIVLGEQSNIAPTSCTGVPNGSVTIIHSGGQGSRVVTISSGEPAVVINATTSRFDNLYAGTYVVKVTDQNGCFATTNVTLNTPSGNNINIVETAHTDAPCFNGVGSTTINVSGGTNPLSVQFNSGTAQVVSSGASIQYNNLSAGTYNVLVTDGGNCKRSFSVVIKQPAQLAIQNIDAANVNCYGGSTGSIHFGLVGGTAPYTVNLTNNVSPSFSQSQTVAAAGPVSFTGLQGSFSGITYFVAILDANGCNLTPTSIATLTQPLAPLSLSLSSIGVKCNGEANGSITASANGGTINYSFALYLKDGLGNFNLFRDPQASNVFDGLAAGQYMVVVTDAKGCSTDSKIDVTEPAKLLINNVVVNNTTKCNAPDGSIFVQSVAGGTTPYAYLFQEVSANGTPIGTQYTNGGNALKNALNAGRWKVTVKDANGCMASSIVQLDKPADPIVLSPDVMNVSCASSTSGSADLTGKVSGVSGGVFLTKWFKESNNNPFASNQTKVNGLGVGQYHVEVTDAVTFCSKTVYFSVGVVNPLVIVSANVKNISCAGQNDGLITVEAAGGASQYTFELYNSVAGNAVGAPLATVTSNTPNFQSPNLSANKYLVSVKENGGCKIWTGELTVNNPAPLAVTVNAKTDVYCFGQNTGAIDINKPTGGVTFGNNDYNYAWSRLGFNGLETSVANSQDISNVFAGNYRLRVTDANGCVLTQDYIVSQPASELIVQPTSVTNASCFGSTAGTSATILAAGGTPISGSLYNIKWYNVNDLVNPVAVNTLTIANVAAGTYRAVVKDANDCEKSINVTIQQPVQLTSLVQSVEASTCTGANANGSIQILTEGGVKPYTYTWFINGVQSNLITNQNTFSLTNLAGASQYVIDVKDANGCSPIEPIVVNVANNLLGVQVSKLADIQCKGDATGAASVEIAGGQSPFTVVWNGIGAVPAGQNVTNLPAGVNTVVVTDAKGCSVSGQVTINEPTISKPAMAFTTNQTLCNGGADGDIGTSVFGGSTIFTYMWQNQAGDVISSNQDLIDVVAGLYTLTIKDVVTGCEVSESVLLQQPTSLPLQINASAVTNPACNGSDNGSIVVSSISGGASPFAYNWVNVTTGVNLNINSATADNLKAGEYKVTVSDTNGCSVSKTYVLTNPTALSIVSISGNQVACGLAASGDISVFAIGGTGVISFTIRNANGAIVAPTGLELGKNYTAIVSDANGCSAEQAFIVQSNSNITFTVSSTNVTCAGGSNGTILVAATGGNGVYSYLLNDVAQNDSSFVGLMADTYKVTVRDGNLCEFTTFVTISEPTALSVSGQVVNVSCVTETKGSVELFVFGGTEPYSYLWSDSSTSKNIENLDAGVYSVMVTDANGCSVVDSFVVTKPAAIEYSFEKIDAGCFGSASGSINLTVSGGSGAFAFSWSKNDEIIATTEDLDSLNSGQYVFVISDSAGCVVRDTVIVGQSTLGQQPHLTLVGNDTICQGQSVQINAGSDPNYFSFLWNNGQVGQNTQVITVGVSGLYFVTINTPCGQVNSDTVYIHVNPAPVEPIIVKIGGTTLSTQLQDSSLAYQWIFNDQPIVGATESTLNPTETGEYKVQVTNDAGCSNISLGLFFVSTGIAESNVLSLELYPNPTQGAFNIRADWTAGDKVSVEIVNQLGQTVVTQQYTVSAEGETLSLQPELAVGVYNVKVTSNGRSFTGKLARN